MRNEMVLKLVKEYASHDFYEKYNYTGDDLGSYCDGARTTFKIWSPIATNVTLNLYETGDPDCQPYKMHRMQVSPQGVWSYEVEQDLSNQYYTFTVTALGDTNEIGDIYAKACGVNGEKSMVINLAKTNPDGWEEDSFYYDSKLQPIIYELHVKDFSHDKNSGVCDEHRGKFLAFKSGKKCMDHLKKLGITHVHLLPITDFASINEDDEEAEFKFNWGYDPMSYNIPEGLYSTNHSDGSVRIKEAKEMIKALHDAGIGVIMDVVYNHTYKRDSFFHHSVPYYYYRSNHNGHLTNGSGCGNETASERFMFRKFMIDSLLYWLKEYHIDGFRFDLMGLHDVETMNLIRKTINEQPNGESILLYGEPWYAEPPCMLPGSIPATKDNLNLLDTNIAIFSDDTRDLLKGNVFDAGNKGYVSGNYDLRWSIPSVVTGWCNSYRMDVYYPSQIISYVSAHDNLTLFDKLVLSNTGNTDHFANPDSHVLQINKLCAGILFTSCGASFFQAGGEFARTKFGNDNSYNTDPDINKLDWKRAEKNKDLIKFYSDMIAFRKTIPVFMDKRANPKDHISFLSDQQNAIVTFAVADNKDREIMVIYNPIPNPVTYMLPRGEYKVLCDGKQFVKTDKVYREEMQITGSACTILVKV